MAKAGVIAPLAKQALKDGVSADELVAAHPELDEKALRRGYAQVKSKAGKGGGAKPKGKKKASKKTGKRVAAQAKAAAPVVAVAPAPGKPPSDSLLRRFILAHGTNAVKAAIAELES